MKIIYALTTLAVILSTSTSYASNYGAVCELNSGPYGGGKLTFKLIPTSGKETFEMSVSLSKADGSNPRVIPLGGNLDCVFSKIDPVAAVCTERTGEALDSRSLNYLKIDKVIRTSVNEFGGQVNDRTITSYDLTVTSPTVQDKDLNALIWYGVYPGDLNVKNKNFKLSFSKEGLGLSGCKPL
jgi:hypothetical protein